MGPIEARAAIVGLWRQAEQQVDDLLQDWRRLDRVGGGGLDRPVADSSGHCVEEEVTADALRRNVRFRQVGESGLAMRP